MKWFNSRRRASRQIKTIPNFEPLETRWVPSAGYGPGGLFRPPPTTEHGTGNSNLGGTGSNTGQGDNGDLLGGTGSNTAQADTAEGKSSAASRHAHNGSPAEHDWVRKSSTTIDSFRIHAGGSHDTPATMVEEKTKTSKSDSNTHDVLYDRPKFHPPPTTEHGGYTVGNLPGNRGGTVGNLPGNGSPGTDAGHFDHGSATGQSASKATGAKAKARSHTHMRGSHQGSGSASKGKSKTAKTSSGTWVPWEKGGPSFEPPGTTESGSGANNSGNVPPSDPPPSRH
jgi:hypothetical protein